jgi:hypothetical protein
MNWKKNNWTDKKGRQRFRFYETDLKFLINILQNLVTNM